MGSMQELLVLQVHLQDVLQHEPDKFYGREYFPEQCTVTHLSGDGYVDGETDNEEQYPPFDAPGEGNDGHQYGKETGKYQEYGTGN